MPNLFSRLAAAAGLALSLPLIQPAQANFLPPGADTQVIENLAQLPNIPIESFPDIILTQEMLDQLAAVGTPLPVEAQPGMAIAAEDLFRVGNFEPFGLPEASLDNIAQVTGVSTETVALAEVPDLLEVLSFKDLVSGIPDLADQPLSEVPAIQNLLVQSLFERLRLGDNQSLRAIRLLLQESPGSFSALTQPLREAIAPGQQLSLDSIPQDWIDRGLGRLDGIFAPTLSDSLLDDAVGNLKVGELAQGFPALEEMPLSNLSPEVLQDLSLQDSVPGLTTIPIERFNDIEALPLSSFGPLNLQSLSLGQMPDPMQLAGGVRFGVADVALGDPDAGSHEQRRMRVVSGGITSKRKKLTARRCTGNECPHFELADPGSAYNGAAWMDGKTQVPDGFGLLCRPFRCKGPAGNHPFGSGVRVQLRNIDQAAGTAQVTLSFAYCRRILFVGKTCTPWVFPVPSGIPIGTIGEETVLPYAPPAQVK